MSYIVLVNFLFNRFLYVNTLFNKIQAIGIIIIFLKKTMSISKAVALSASLVGSTYGMANDKSKVLHSDMKIEKKPHILNEYSTLASLDDHFVAQAQIDPRKYN